MSSERLIPPDVVGDIYEAALDENGLERLVAIVRRVVDVDSAGIWLRKGEAITDLTVSEDIAASAVPYLAHFIRIDPWAARLTALNRVSLGSEIVDESALVRSEFYNDFARHYGMLRPMGIRLGLGSNAHANISTNRGSRRHLLDADDKARFAALAVHLRGALRLRQRHGAVADRHSDLSAALDGLAFATIICAADGAVVFANDAARAMEDTGLLQLGKAAGGLTAGSSERTASLRALVAAAALAGQPGGLQLAGADHVPVSVLVTPLPAARPHPGKGRALVSLRRADAAAAPAAETLRRLFGLTPNQAQLCVQLARGLTFEAAAKERGVALSTARTHLLGALQKTGTENLRDLLRLLGALPQIRALLNLFPLLSAWTLNAPLA